MRPLPKCEYSIHPSTAFLLDIGGTPIDHRFNTASQMMNGARPCSELPFLPDLPP